MASGGLAALASGVFLSACSTFGIRTTEEPAYQVIDRVGGTVEVRQYGARIAAETAVGGDAIAARSAGFRRIAGYIFGANIAPGGLAETKSQTIAMTAPVAQGQDATGAWRIRFFMPAAYTMNTLPKPTDPRVLLVEVPAETMAVLRFSGLPSTSAVQGAEQRLAQALGASPWHPAGTAVAWFYDPPWTIPPLRRNEVALPVTR